MAQFPVEQRRYLGAVVHDIAKVCVAVREFGVSVLGRLCSQMIAHAQEISTHRVIIGCTLGSKARRDGMQKLFAVPIERARDEGIALSTATKMVQGQRRGLKRMQRGEAADGIQDHRVAIVFVRRRERTFRKWLSAWSRSIDTAHEKPWLAGDLALGIQPKGVGRGESH